MDGGTHLKLVSFGDEYCTTDTAADLLSQQLGFKFVNHANRLSTNHKIFRDVVKYTVEKNTEDAILLIGWTTPFRRDGEHGGKYFVYSPDCNDYPSKQYKKLHKYDHYLFDEILIHNTWAGLVYGLQEYLQNLDIKYYMYNTQVSLQFNPYTHRILRNLDGKMYNDPINQNSTMIKYLELNGYKNIDAQAQNTWANFLLQKFRSNGIIKKQ